METPAPAAAPPLPPPPPEAWIMPTPSPSSVLASPPTKLETPGPSNPSSTKLETPGPSNPSSSQVWHKNRLQEYAQRSALPLPSYHTVNEGPSHPPKFSSTVVFDGATYKSANTFTQRKEAEQDVAKLAWESILKKLKDEGCPLIDQDTTFCKSILNEFAIKVKVELPTYTTNKSEGKFPVFISTVVFNGNTYNGNVGRSKREAEQLGARAVIKSILGTELGSFLSTIINSKNRLFAALHKCNSSNTSQVIPFSEEIAQVIDDPQPQLKKPKLEASNGTSNGFIENGTGELNQPPFSGQLVLSGSQTAPTTPSGRKNPRKKSKSSKRSEASMQPLIPASPCSVAQ